MASKKNVKAVPEQKEQVRMASVQDSSGDGKGTESEWAGVGAQADGRGQRRAGPRAGSVEMFQPHACACTHKAPSRKHFAGSSSRSRNVRATHVVMCTHAPLPVHRELHG